MAWELRVTFKTAYETPDRLVATHPTKAMADDEACERMAKFMPLVYHCLNADSTILSTVFVPFHNIVYYHVREVNSEPS